MEWIVALGILYFIFRIFNPVEKAIDEYNENKNNDPKHVPYGQSPLDPSREISSNIGFVIFLMLFAAAVAGLVSFAEMLNIQTLPN